MIQKSLAWDDSKWCLALLSGEIIKNEIWHDHFSVLVVTQHWMMPKFVELIKQWIEPSVLGDCLLRVIRFCSHDNLLPCCLWVNAFVKILLHFAICISGEVYYAPVSRKMTFEEASKECKRKNAVLATPGQLHAAWRLGLDRCDYGWLSDGSARHPVAVPRMKCGGGLLGVRTMYRYRNQTGFPEPTTKLGAYCFKGKPTHRVLLLVFAIFTVCHGIKCYLHMVGNMVEMFIVWFRVIGGTDHSLSKSGLNCEEVVWLYVLLASLILLLLCTTVHIPTSEPNQCFKMFTTCLIFCPLLCSLCVCFFYTHFSFHQNFGSNNYPGGENNLNGKLFSLKVMDMAVLILIGR